MHFISSPPNVFFYSLDLILIINPVLPGYDSIKLKVERICGLIERFHQINNNLYIYYRDANYYASNYSRENQKTML